MTNRFLFAELLASLLLGLGVLGCQPTEPRISPEPKSSPRVAPGPLTVRITSATSKRPLAGVLVRVGGRHVGTATDGLAILDGLPAGTYPLVIEQYGFERYAKTIELQAGKREAIPVMLSPVEPANLTGLVSLEDSAQPVAGAHIAFVPVAVRAAIQGRYDFHSDWDGKFNVLEIPPGLYRVEISVPGCLDYLGELEVKPGKADIAFRLTRDTEPADLKVTVRNSATTKPVRNARVILAEAWPKGMIAEARTDESGVANFPKLRVGQLNWSDAKDRVPVSRRNCTVRVEAEGHEADSRLVTINPGSSANVDLNPVAKITEQEPNDSLQTATPISTGANVEFRLVKDTDVDYFRFRLPHPAFLRSGVDSKGIVGLHLQLLDRQGKPVRETWTSKENNMVQELGVPAGEYSLRVVRWGSEPSDKLLTLRVACTTAADALEPNDSIDAARVLRTGEEVRGTFLPVGDNDYFRFDLPRPSVVRIALPPHPLARIVYLRDLNGKEVASSTAYANKPLELIASLPAGRHVLQAGVWGNNAESTDPYSLRFDVIGDDGVDDPKDTPGRLLSARSLTPGSQIGSTLLPVGDRDVYTISLPTAGLIRVQAVAPIGMTLRIRSATGQILAESSNYPQLWAGCTWSNPGSGTIYAEVRHWGDSEWSASPYVLRCLWEPSDELEAVGRNDSIETATPVEIGEVLRGSICPVRDVDCYRLEVDHPGFLKLDGIAPLATTVRILTARGKELASVQNHADQRIQLGAEVPVGECVIEVSHWGNSESHVGAYTITPKLDRAEPVERAPLRDEPLRQLKLGEAQPFAIDQLGDRDRFLVSVTEAGKYAFYIRAMPAVTVTVFDDRTGTKVGEWSYYENTAGKQELEAKGPTRYRLEVTGWGNVRSSESGHLMVDVPGRELRLDRVDALVNPFHPVEVTFIRQSLKGYSGISKVQVDADGDGKVDFEIEEGKSHTWRYPAEGVYSARVWMEADNGTRTLSRLWVEAIGPRERKGISLLVSYPAEGQVIERDLACRLRALSYTGEAISRVEYSLDNQPVAVAIASPFTAEIPWRKMGPGKHVLSITASDTRGARATVTRAVQLSEYFDLLPEDGAVVTGNDVRVSWSGTAFGPNRVRYRLQGTEAWQEVVGESGRDRSVVLTGLEGGKAYEFQPLGAEPGPVRTVTRVKGLAFGRPRYGATIARDYDQRVGISVRNHAEQPLIVRLECGKPTDHSLLVGFVGEGSEGAPFALKPGEERDFLLGLSAQDVTTAQHRFPIRIVSTGAFTDEAEVDVLVRLPVVKLDWEPLGPAPYGLGQLFRVHNRGDTVTDLNLSASSADVTLTPSVSHGLLMAGQSLDVTAYPRLYEGFQKVETKLRAKAVGTVVETDLVIALPEKLRVHSVLLEPGTGGITSPPRSEVLRRAQTMVGAHLNPAKVDWSAKQPLETAAAGSVSRWSVLDPVGDVLWIGEDGAGTGEMDFVTADVGSQGRPVFAAIRVAGKWQETNLLDAWLEITFRLPWARNQYEKHSVDVLFNGKVVGELRDTIPEGNFAFRISPALLRLGGDGVPGDNKVEVRSRHLRGGHYVVSSDFRLKTRLLRAHLWVPAESAEEARKLALTNPELVREDPDYQVSSSELKIEGPPALERGADVRIVVPLRNLGAAGPAKVPVALRRIEPGQPDAELGRTEVEIDPLTGNGRVQFPWKATAGTHTLKLLVDPDNKLGDRDRDNNEAVVTVGVAAGGAKPTLRIVAPADGAVLKNTVVSLAAEAKDEVGIARVEVSIDGGLWYELGPTPDNTHTGQGLLQPGQHRLTVRATANSGQVTEQSVKVRVETAVPELTILEPKENHTATERQIPVRLRVGPETALAAVRINGGAWRRLSIRDGQAEGKIPLTFGPIVLEGLVAGPQGATRTTTVRVTCTRQPGKDEVPEGASSDAGAIAIEGFGTVDLFGPLNLARPSRPMAPGGPRGQRNAILDRTFVVFVDEPAVPATAPTAETTTLTAQTRKSDWYCTNRPEVTSSLPLGSVVQLGLRGYGPEDRNRDTRAIYNALLAWIEKYQLNENHRQVLLAILSNYFYTIDGELYGDWRNAIHALNQTLREGAEDTLSWIERWLVEIGKTDQSKLGELWGDINPFRKGLMEYLKLIKRPEDIALFERLLAVLEQAKFAVRREIARGGVDPNQLERLMNQWTQRMREIEGKLRSYEMFPNRGRPPAGLFDELKKLGSWVDKFSGNLQELKRYTQLVENTKASIPALAKFLDKMKAIGTGADVLSIMDKFQKFESRGLSPADALTRSAAWFIAHQGLSKFPSYMVADIVSGVLGLTKPSTAVEVMTDFLLEGAGVVASRAGAGSVNVFQEGFRNVPPQKVSDSLAQIEKRLDAKDFADNQERDRLLKLRKLLREVQQAEKKK